MKNLIQETGKAIKRVRTVKSWMVISAFALVGGLALLGSSLPGQVAAADTGNVNVIFTKWVTATPPAPGIIANMAGVVSGDVGGGQYTGEVIAFNPGPTTTAITALYHINGGAHQFTARVNVIMNNSDGTGVITGVVTDGWLKGNKVRGGFQTIYPSGIINAQTGGPFNDRAFQGTLRIALDDQD